MSKIFVIGLPRTGTTSVCQVLLHHNYRVAHTAYTRASFYRADVVADTPVYCDYPFLDNYFPDSKFIYLEREALGWSISMRQMLIRLSGKLASKGSGYHPVLGRSLRQVFDFDGLSEIPSLAVLEEKYFLHRQGVLDYFDVRTNDLLCMDIAKPQAYKRLCDFLGIVDAGKDRGAEFPRLNKDGRIFEWGKIRHPGKVGSNERGAMGRKYFDISTAL